jgi:hypothetical protein
MRQTFIRFEGLCAVRATIALMPEREGDKERIDRELIELLNELRVALPGVQVLFAFLLILPFQQRFSEVGEIDRLVYAAALVSSAVAAALLIAPSVHHRVNFRRRNKERLLLDSNALLIAGTAFTAVGIVCSAYLVVDVLFGAGVAIAVASGVVVVYGLLWAVLPLRRRGEPDE